MSQHLAWLIIIVNPKSVLPAPEGLLSTVGAPLQTPAHALHDAVEVSRSKSGPVCGLDPQTGSGVPG